MIEELDNHGGKSTLDKQSDTDHVAGISRERIDRSKRKKRKRKRTPHEETRTKPYTTKIGMRIEYHKEKGGYPRIKQTMITLRHARSTKQTERDPRSKDSE
jgi:hypothetical protein